MRAAHRRQGAKRVLRAGAGTVGQQQLSGRGGPFAWRARRPSVRRQILVGHVCLKKKSTPVLHHIARATAAREGSEASFLHAELLQHLW